MLGYRRFLPTLLMSVFLIPAAVIASKPEPTRHWNQIGKSAHRRYRSKSVKERSKLCATACHKAGARKAGDLGACKEGCVFG
jgi:hypothetical protein